MTPSPTPSEGEAMLALADEIENDCDSGGVLLNETEADTVVKVLRAAAQSSGVREIGDAVYTSKHKVKVLKIVGDRAYIESHDLGIFWTDLAHLSPDTTREITVEQLDQAQFGRVLHKRPDTSREREYDPNVEPCDDAEFGMKP